MDSDGQRESEAVNRLLCTFQSSDKKGRQNTWIVRMCEERRDP